MLSIGKLVSGAESYYLEAVAKGREEYYTGAGEAPGVWMGGAAAALGLSGEVAADALHLVLSGISPRDGTAFAARRSSGVRVAGFDFTFSAPKSASLLYGLGDPAQRGAVKAAHDEAVRAGLSYLDAHAVFARRGAGGRDVISTRGLVAAGFCHRTSRAGDPQLHTHVLVANVVEGEDGRASALYARPAYFHARTAGFVYQAVLRHGLAGTLGVRFGPVATGTAEIAGIDPVVLRHFSTRRQAIEDRLDERGARSARAAQVATIATREPKRAVPLPGPDDLAGTWRARAAAHGFDLSFLDVLGREPRRVAFAHEAAAALVASLLGPDGLTASESAFERRDVVREIAAGCPDGAPLAVIDRLAEMVMSSPLVVELPTTGNGGEPRQTTADLLATERELLALASAQKGALEEAVPPGIADAVIGRRPALGADQARMVRRLAGSCDGVAVVVGAAGTGKTAALEAVAAAYRAAGHRVVGTALAARAAAELASGARIEAGTLAALAGTLARGRAGIGRGDLLVVDEAAMVGTRLLADVVSKTTALGARVVLVGDDRQLPPIEAGGTFTALVTDLGGVPLTVNHRQREAWERSALDAVREGDVAGALSAYERAGRIHEAPSAEGARRACVDDFCAAHASGADAVILASTRADVASLNALTRRVLRDQGLLHDDIVADGPGFARGDAVVFLANDTARGVTNGTRGQVLDARGTGLVVATSAGAVCLDASFVGSGRLAHGYATTVHKAQGATVDQAFVYLTSAIFQEAGYVALSRARDQTSLYLPTGAFEDGLGMPSPQERPRERLARALGRSRAKRSATAELACGVGVGAPDRRDAQRAAQTIRAMRLRVPPALHLAERAVSSEQRERTSPVDLLGPPPGGGLAGPGQGRRL